MSERGPKNEEGWKELAFRVGKGLAMIAFGIVAGVVGWNTIFK